jgi:hypothetical protein
MPAGPFRRTAQVKGALIAGALLMLIAGCNQPPAATTAPTTTPAAVAVPTASTTPAPSRLVLVAPVAGSDAAGAALAAQAESALKELAMGAGMDLIRLEAMPEGDAAGVALLVALPPDPGLQAWAASHAEAQSVSLGITGLQPAPNLSVVAPDGIRYDQLGFALGYLAAMVTPEYRVGALAIDASPTSLALARGFVAGGTYYCGLCRPAHPPYVAYPAFFEGGQPDLAAEGLSTLLVVPQPGSLSDLGLAASSEIAFIGPGNPVTELANLWIASADFDVATALGAAWTQSQSGQGGTTIPLGIRFHSVNPLVVTEGRLALAEALLADISAGLIDTGIDPLTGELR